jgi:pimeloyl-ACP methyl ester carboxylesterase
MRFEMWEPQGAPRGTVVLLHGFGRSPAALEELAQRLAARGATVLGPHLSAWWWPSCTNNTRYLTRVAREIVARGCARPMVVVGHSAGAAAGAWIASTLRDQGVPVAGLVLVDGVESPVGSLRRSWPRLRGVPVTALCGSPSPCNRRGALQEWLQSREVDSSWPLEIVRIEGMGHGDIEGAGLMVYRRLCGDAPTAPARAELLGRVEAAIERAWSASAK